MHGETRGEKEERTEDGREGSFAEVTLHNKLNETRVHVKKWPLIWANLV